MECKATTNAGTQCSRIAEPNSKYCWQHRNYDIGETKENITTHYFENTPLLQNTLLSYFEEGEILKTVNKQFSELNYEKYNTHPEPHGIKETYYRKTKILKTLVTYKNGKKNGIYEKYYINGKLAIRKNYKNGIENGLYESWYDNGQLTIRCNYKNGKRDSIWEEWNEDGQLIDRSNYKNGILDGISKHYTEDGQLFMEITYENGKPVSKIIVMPKLNANQIGEILNDT